MVPYSKLLLLLLLPFSFLQKLFSLPGMLFLPWPEKLLILQEPQIACVAGLTLQRGWLMVLFLIPGTPRKHVIALSRCVWECLSPSLDWRA